jgi:cytochrome c
MIRIGLLALAAVTFAAPTYADDPAAGEQVFRKCIACHAIGEGAQNKIGPHLNGIFGRPAGSVPGYNYSDANETFDAVWTEENFAEFIHDPRGVMPGTKMSFPGLKDDQEISDLIAYLKQFDAGGNQAAVAD